MEQLYTKEVSPKGKISYKPYKKTQTMAEFELDNRQIVSLAGTIGTCVLIGLERHLPQHSLLSRRIRALEEAIRNLASIHSCDLDQNIVEAGLAAWGAAMEKLGEELCQQN